VAAAVAAEAVTDGRSRHFRAPDPFCTPANFAGGAGIFLAASRRGSCLIPQLALSKAARRR
jgi:hypothetical protein